MAFTTQQFEELANLYGEIADGKQKKREHVLAKRLEEAERLTPVINAAQDRIDALLPGDLSEVDKTRLSQDFTLYHKHPATLSRNSIDKILPGFAAFAESRLSDELTVDLTKQRAGASAPVAPPTVAGDSVPVQTAPAPAPTQKTVSAAAPVHMEFTTEQFDEIASICARFNEGVDNLRAAKASGNSIESENAHTVCSEALADLDKLLPPQVLKSEGISFKIQLCNYYSSDPIREELARKRFDKSLPGFAAYAEQKIVEAGDLYEKGRKHYSGDGVPKEEAAAFEYFMQAARLGHVVAMTYLGIIYANGKGVVQDDALAFKWYQKAAERDNVYSMREVGNFYYNGRGVAQNYDLAYEWFRKAADKGNVISLNDVGLCYFYGHGVEKDFQSAAQWYQKAADKGEVYGMRNLGRIYHYGYGVEEDFEKARFWYIKSLEGGNRKVETDLQKLTDDEARADVDFRKWRGAAADKELIQSLIDPNDVKEFGREEAEFIAGAVHARKDKTPNIHEIAERYRQALRNGGPVEGVHYTKDDTLFVMASPERIASKVEGRSGKKQSVTGDYIDAATDALNQYTADLFAAYDFKDAVRQYLAAKAHLRCSPDSYQMMCEKMLETYTKWSSYELIEMIDAQKEKADPLYYASGLHSNSTIKSLFSGFELDENDLGDVRAIVAQANKLSNMNDIKHSFYSGLNISERFLFLADSDEGSDDMFSGYDFRRLYFTSDLLYLCDCLGEIELGKKGRLFKAAVPDKFIGINPDKLAAYKSILEAALPRLLDKITQLEYRMLFGRQKLMPDVKYLNAKYLSEYRNAHPEYTGSSDISFHRLLVNGGAEVIPELFFEYNVTSELGLEHAIYAEHAKNRDFEDAVNNEYWEVRKVNDKWNDYVRNKTADSNILVSEPLRKKYIRATYGDVVREQARANVIARGMSRSRIYRPTDKYSVYFD